MWAGKPRTTGTRVRPTLRAISIESPSSLKRTWPKLTIPRIDFAALVKCGAMLAHGAHPSVWNAIAHASRPFSITAASNSSSVSARTRPSSGYGDCAATATTRSARTNDRIAPRALILGTSSVTRGTRLDVCDDRRGRRTSPKLPRRDDAR